MRTRFFSAGLTASVIAFLLCGSSSNLRAADDAVPYTARVVRLHGGARWSSDLKVWQDIRKGQVLPSGTLVQTALGKVHLDLELGESGPGAPPPTLIRLYSGALLGLDRLAVTSTGSAQAEHTELDLRAGKILCVFNRLAGGAECHIQFTNGVAGIQGNVAGAQGTVCVLDATGLLDVLRGIMVVALAKENATAKTVISFQRFNPSTGEVEPMAAKAPERKLWPVSAAASPSTSTQSPWHFDGRGNPVFPFQSR
jgi:hypothetical protein